MQSHSFDPSLRRVPRTRGSHSREGAFARNATSQELSPSARIRQEGIAPDLADAEPILDRYRVMELRDVGGFGSVLVCWDVRLQRRVAVKRMPLEASASAVTIDEALAEARASSFLAHPNIVTVHDFEVAGDEAYLVMEYVDGVTLSELMARVEGGVLIFDEVAYVLRCLASALSFAHKNGVLHLDIKPQNVLIDHRGQVKLTDFGMASLASFAGWGGARGGTVGYMAPEQLEGELVDERSDVFSLAVVVYEMLTGIQPFAAPTAEQSLKLIEKGAPDVGELEPELDPGVASALMAALSPEASAREPSVDRFSAQLLEGAGKAPIIGPDATALPAGTLGDPERGRASILGLLGQAKASEPAFNEQTWRNLDPPGRRIPWLAKAFARAANGAATAGLAMLAFLALNIPELWRLGLCAVAATVGACAPSMGSLFGVVALTVALFVQAVMEAEGTIALLYAAAIFCAGLIWWIAFGSEGRIPTACLLGPAALLQPSLGANISGYGLRPLAAFVTGAASAALAQVSTGVLWVNAYLVDIPALAQKQSVSAFGPGGWLLIGGCATGALLCSALNRLGARRLLLGKGGGRALSCVGQCLATACAAGGLIAGQALENSWIFAAPTGLETVILLGSLALMLIITGLFGPALEFSAVRSDSTHAEEA